MSYELWDTDTGNLVEAFEDEMSALIAARELIAINSDVYPAMLTLLAISNQGDLSTIASGDVLGARANAAMSAARGRSPRANNSEAAEIMPPVPMSCVLEMEISRCGRNRCVARKPTKVESPPRSRLRNGRFSWRRAVPPPVASEARALFSALGLV